MIFITVSSRPQRSMTVRETARSDFFRERRSACLRNVESPHETGAAQLDASRE